MIKNCIFLAGATLMVIGAAATIPMWAGAPWCFAAGALAFTSIQMLQRYDGQNFAIRRLRKIVIISDILFLLSAALMIADQNNLLQLDYFTYLRYVHRNWVVTLLIAAVLQVYTSHRIGQEMEKEAKKL
jgi:hypothetical protein